MANLAKLLGAESTAEAMFDEKLLVQELTNTLLPKLAEILKPVLAIAESPLLCREGFEVKITVGRKKPEGG